MIVTFLAFLGTPWGHVFLAYWALCSLMPFFMFFRGFQSIIQDAQIVARLDVLLVPAAYVLLASITIIGSVILGIGNMLFMPIAILALGAAIISVELEDTWQKINIWLHKPIRP